MSDWRDDGVMIHYKKDFIEINSHDLDRLMADQARLEWMANAEVFPMNTKEGWCLSGDGATCWTKTHDSFRDAIDEAMRESE